MNTSYKARKEEPIFVTDTSWWMEFAGESWKLRHGRFVIPECVLRELDGLKMHPVKGTQARRAISRLYELTKSGLVEIVKPSGRPIMGALQSERDEEVVNVARDRLERGEEVYLLTTDKAQMVLAGAFGIKTAEWLVPRSGEHTFRRNPSFNMKQDRIDLSFDPMWLFWPKVVILILLAISVIWP